ncbi:AzlC family ABC transporter permease [Microbispora hainanensis]|uniref:AzlC family ABC transporter permease n=1 Tax=Microbispora TaxID=2005 RepID=UPI0011C798AD|nr:MULTISPECIES: AzlC family ABC transporter permease [Microbispora]
MHSLWRTLDRGTLRDIALVCLADAMVGAAFGAISVSGGLPAWVPVVMSLLVFAGGAQFAAVGVVLSGGAPIAAVAAGLVLNARLLPFGFAIGDVLGGRWWTRLTGAHLMTDEAVAFVLRDGDPRRRHAAFWACGLGLFVSWNAAVVLGALAGRGIGDTGALGLDAAFPAVLLALVLPSLTERNARTATLRRACLLGGVVAVAATPFLPAGLPVLLALTGLVLAVRTPSGAEVPCP